MKTTFCYFLISFATVLAAAGANPVPLVTQPLNPAVATPGGPGFNLTVRGAGFVSGSVVNWNGNPRSTEFVSSSQLNAQILASDVENATTASVTVTNPSPGGGTSSPAYFEVTIPNLLCPYLRHGSQGER